MPQEKKYKVFRVYTTGYRKLMLTDLTEQEAKNHCDKANAFHVRDTKDKPYYKDEYVEQTKP